MTSHVQRLEQERNWKVRETTWGHLEDAVRGLRCVLVPTPEAFGMEPYEADLALKGIERIVQNLKEEQETKLEQAKRGAER